MGRAGRPAEYRNAAEKQKAYRDRKKQQDQTNLVMLDMQNWLDQQIVALRNWVAYWEGKGKSVEIAKAGLAGDFGKALVVGYSNYHIEAAVWRYALLTGVLVFDRQRGWDALYTLTSPQLITE